MLPSSGVASNLRSGVLFLSHGAKRYFLAACLKKSTLDRRLDGQKTLKLVRNYERDLSRFNKVTLVIGFLQKCNLFDSSPSSWISSSVDRNFMIRKPVADSRRIFYRAKLRGRQFCVANTRCRLNLFCPP